MNGHIDIVVAAETVASYYKQSWISAYSMIMPPDDFLIGCIFILADEKSNLFLKVFLMFPITKVTLRSYCMEILSSLQKKYELTDIEVERIWKLSESIRLDSPVFYNHLPKYKI